MNFSGYGLGIGLAGKFPDYAAIQARKEALAQAHQDRMDKIAAQDAAKGEAIAQRITAGISANFDKAPNVISKKYIDLSKEYIADLYDSAEKAGGIQKYITSQDYAQKQAVYKSAMKEMPVEVDAYRRDWAKLNDPKSRWRVKQQYEDVIHSEDPYMFRALNNNKTYTEGTMLEQIEPEDETRARLTKIMLDQPANTREIGKPLVINDANGIRYQHNIEHYVSPKIVEEKLGLDWDNNKVIQTTHPDKQKYIDTFKDVGVVKQSEVNSNPRSDFSINYGGGNGIIANNGLYALVQNDPQQPNEVVLQKLGNIELPKKDFGKVPATMANGQPYPANVSGEVQGFNTSNPNKPVMHILTEPAKYDKYTRKDLNGKVVEIDKAEFDAKKDMYDANTDKGQYKYIKSEAILPSQVVDVPTTWNNVNTLTMNKKGQGTIPKGTKLTSVNIGTNEAPKQGNVGKTQKFVVNGVTYNIPESEVAAFKKDMKIK
jgi:hypothetical protein